MSFAGLGFRMLAGMSARLHVVTSKARSGEFINFAVFLPDVSSNGLEVPKISGLCRWGACPQVFKVTVLGVKVKISVKDLAPPC